MPDIPGKVFNRLTIVLIIVVGIVLFVFLIIMQFVFFPLFLPKTSIIDIKVTPYSMDTIKTIQSISLQQYPGEETIVPGVFTIGMIVQIQGTGGDGLRMRQLPGTQNEVLLLAQDGEIFQIVQGPEIEDGLIWWKIQSIEDSTIDGWSVQDYMNIINIKKD